jgi:aryl-alcohol dehydrogenase-like predicted oxidoreductase
MMKIKKKELVLGTAQLGSRYGLNNSNVSKKQSFKILEYAWKNGIKTYDTAASYNSQKILGEFIKTNGIYREIKIYTKISSLKFENVIGIKKRLEKNIKELNTKPEITFLHDERDLNKLKKNIGDLTKESLTNNFGVSIYNYKNSYNYFNYKNFFYQFPYNLIDRRFVNFKINKKNCIARSIFLQGLLISKIKKKINKKYKNLLNRFQLEYFNLCKKNNICAKKLAYHFILQSNNFNQFIVGIDHIDQIDFFKKKVKKLIYKDLKIDNFFERWKRIADPRLW